MTGWKSTDQSYGKLSICMHWLMLLLLVGVYACIELRVLYPKGSDPREALKAWHFMLGLSVFALVWIRIATRLMEPTPSIEPAPSALENLLAKAMHGVLYLMMIGLPLVGWLSLSAAGKPVLFFGLPLPALTAENKALAKALKEFHEVAGKAGYILIGLHAAAALFHHYIKRDNTLIRMLPHK
ncbi:cytochrome b561 [Formivibrio citricus]|uniref:Cytochrome b561 n=1 Tax=Formivibrio citricus TaxID=83765 RepID=A0A1I4WV29_9NEIS|nr:cytochrome b [Formivibrio citricus]SFN17026.1 cytochrome b561 [Formivibrio citricus]